MRKDRGEDKKANADANERICQIERRPVVGVVPVCINEIYNVAEPESVEQVPYGTPEDQPERDTSELLASRDTEAPDKNCHYCCQ